jgi:hypothetical protein
MLPSRLSLTHHAYAASVKVQLTAQVRRLLFTTRSRLLHPDKNFGHRRRQCVPGSLCVVPDHESFHIEREQSLRPRTHECFAPSTLLEQVADLIIAFSFATQRCQQSSTKSGTLSCGSGSEARSSTSTIRRTLPVERSLLCGVAMLLSRIQAHTATACASSMTSQEKLLCYLLQANRTVADKRKHSLSHTHVFVYVCARS